MSNSLPSALFANIDRYAYAYARGKDAFADMFLDTFAYVQSANVTVSETIARDLYVATRTKAELIAVAADKPLKEQSDKSRNSQVSKLHNAYLLGELAREHNAAISDAMDAAARKTARGYTKLIKCATAVKSLFVNPVDPASVTLEEMIWAIDNALIEAPETAATAVRKQHAAWLKLVEGKGEEPSPFAGDFARLRAAYPADWMNSVAENLDAIARFFEAEDAEKEALAKAAKAAALAAEAAKKAK